MFLSQERGKHEKTFESDGYVYYLDHSDGFMVACLYLDPSNYIHSIRTLFVYQLYLNEAVKKMYK